MSAGRLKWTREEVFAFLAREFPQALRPGTDYQVTALEPGRAVVRLAAGEAQLRPGGTVSGPALMELVDFAVYVLLLAHHGEQARLAVTTNLAISFLRKPRPGPVEVEVMLIKHGRTLSVARCDLRAAGEPGLVASAEATYFMGGA